MKNDNDFPNQGFAYFPKYGTDYLVNMIQIRILLYSRLCHQQNHHLLNGTSIFSCVAGSFFAGYNDVRFLQLNKQNRRFLYYKKTKEETDAC